MHVRSEPSGCHLLYFVCEEGRLVGFRNPLPFRDSCFIVVRLLRTCCVIQGAVRNSLNMNNNDGDGRQTGGYRGRQHTTISPRIPRGCVTIGCVSPHLGASSLMPLVREQNCLSAPNKFHASLLTFYTPNSTHLLPWLLRRSLCWWLCAWFRWRLGSSHQLPSHGMVSRLCLVFMRLIPGGVCSSVFPRCEGWFSPSPRLIPGEQGLWRAMRIQLSYGGTPHESVRVQA